MKMRRWLPPRAVKRLVAWRNPLKFWHKSSSDSISALRRAT